MFTDGTATSVREALDRAEEFGLAPDDEVFVSTYFKRGTHHERFVVVEREARRLAIRHINDWYERRFREELNDVNAP